MSQLVVCACPECTGALVLDDARLFCFTLAFSSFVRICITFLDFCVSKPKWRLACNKCNVVVQLFERAHMIKCTKVRHQILFRRHFVMFFLFRTNVNNAARQSSMWNSTSKTPLFPMVSQSSRKRGRVREEEKGKEEREREREIERKRKCESKEQQALQERLRTSPSHAACRGDAPQRLYHVR